MNFRELIRGKLTAQDLQNLANDLGSKTMLTRRINHPEKASHAELLVFAKHLGVSAGQLYDQYAVGKDTLTELQVKSLANAH